MASKRNGRGGDGKDAKKVGRPQAITLNAAAKRKLADLARSQCNQAEAAQAFGVHQMTLNKFLRTNVEARRIWETARASGRLADYANVVDIADGRAPGTRAPPPGHSAKGRGANADGNANKVAPAPPDEVDAALSVRALAQLSHWRLDDDNLFRVVEALGRMQATGEEAASVLGVHPSTLGKWLQTNDRVRLCWDQGQAIGRMSLRRAQMHAALAGNVIAQIWCGKQYLGQRDQRSSEVKVEHVDGRAELRTLLDAMAERASLARSTATDAEVVGDGSSLAAPGEPPR